MNRKLVNLVESLIDLEVYQNPLLRDRENYFFFKIKTILKDINYNLTNEELEELKELIKYYI